MAVERFDVLIIGAGLSGVGAGCRLRMKCPDKSFVLLEAREVSGGTWDLFRYPGIRSDSDMFTLGYPFRPWKDAKALADGPAILKYIRDTAHEYGVDERIRYGHRVVRADWSSSAGVWIVYVAVGPERRPLTIECRFLYCCGGYYDYEGGHNPSFPGSEQFRGRIVHPQKWTPDVNYAGKRVIVIGSGATAVTLVPELAKEAAHVTMLQRSPTYIASLPANDAVANLLRRTLPERWAHRLCRWKNILFSMFFYTLARRAPKVMKGLLRRGVQRELGRDVDLRHFTPHYEPWDQRLCLASDADLFQALRSGKADIVTDEIANFTETGIKLNSGCELPADLIVTATGLKLKLLGGLKLAVDGVPVDFPKHKVYKGMMLSDVPNFAFAIGYTNASWTLKCDLTSLYVCRLLKYLEAKHLVSCIPRLRGQMTDEPLLDFTSGYVQRGLAELPKQGSKPPWRVYQNYVLDLLALGYGRLTDSMEFTNHCERVIKKAG